MMYVASIIAAFVFISIYFFFRAENLQRELILAKRDISNTRRENKFFLDALVLTAKRNEESAKYRLKAIEQKMENCKVELERNHLKMISPLVNNYSAIFIECLKGKGQMSIITKKCYENFQAGFYEEFSTFIGQKDATIKRMWANNNLNGFIALTEALLLEQLKYTESESVVTEVKKVRSA